MQLDCYEIINITFLKTHINYENATYYYTCYFIKIHIVRKISSKFNKLIWVLILKSNASFTSLLQIQAKFFKCFWTTSLNVSFNDPGVILLICVSHNLAKDEKVIKYFKYCLFYFSSKVWYNIILYSNM